MRSFRTAALMLAAAATTLAVVSVAGAYPRINKIDAKLYGENPLPVQGETGSEAGVATLDRDSCFTTGYPPTSEPGGVPGVDKDISCDDSLPPDNETAIVAHPVNANILLAGSNDYQLFFNPGGFVVQRVPAGFFLSMDGGATWVDGQVPMQASYGAGDPAPAFDVKRNRALMASLSFVCGQGSPLCSRGNLAVAYLDLAKARAEIAKNSENPRLPWQDQMVVNGSAADIAAVQIFSDKEWLTVDNFEYIPTPNPNDGDKVMPNPNYGNYYLVYARFRSESFAYDESPIYFTKSENGGAKWTEPVEISGRSTTKCTFQDDPDDSTDFTGDFNRSGVAETPDDPNACDQNQWAYPVVAPDGTLYVHFHNEQNSQAYELPQRYDSQIMLVKSEDGGDTWYGEPNPAESAGCVPQPEAAASAVGACIVPIHIVDLEDSYDSFSQAEDAPLGSTAIPDYPINVNGRTTLTNMQFRVNSAGTITVARSEGNRPTGAYRLYVVYADNCAGVRPAAGMFQPAPGESEEPPPPPSFVPVTDTNLYYAYSDDHGRTWVGGDGRENGRPYNTCGVPGSYGLSGRLVARPGPDTTAFPSDGDDQWFPWIDAHPVTGAPTAVTMDGTQFDGNVVRETYGFTAFSAGPLVLGSPPDFEGPIPLAGAPSHPRQSRFFRAEAQVPLEEADELTCPLCSVFLGDYNGVAVDRLGRIHAVWTDMRRVVAERPTRSCLANPPDEGCPEFPVHGEDVYYAQRPVTP